MDVDFAPWLCLSLAAAAAAAYFIPLLFNRRSNRRLPPGPRPLPIIGNILDVDEHLHRALARLADIHGPLLSIRLGTVHTVVATSPAVAQEILQTHDAVFCDRSPPDALRARDHISNSLIWCPPGAQWRGLRRVCAVELFAAKRLDAHRSLRRQKVQDMLDHIRHLAENNEPVDFARIAFTTGLNMMSRTIFSVDMAELDSSSPQEFKHFVTELMKVIVLPNISDIFPILAPADLQGLRRRNGVLLDRVYEFLDEQIDQRLADRAANQPPKEDMLDVLLDLSEQGDKSGIRLDRPALRGLLSVSYQSLD